MLVRTLVILVSAWLMFVAWNTMAPRLWLPASKWLKVQDHREEIGLDGIYCMKVQLDDDEFRTAIVKRKLIGMESYPSYDTSPPNCQVDWWDIDFPAEAQVYRIYDDGSLRELAAYRNGFYYFVGEVR